MKNNDDLLSVQGSVYTVVDAEGYLVREDIKGERVRYLPGGGGGSSTDNILIVEGEKLKIGGVNEDNTPKFADVDIHGEFVSTHGEGLIVYGPTKKLLSVLDDEFIYKGEYDISKVKKNIGPRGVFLQASDYLTVCTEPFTIIDTFISNVNNCMCIFSTGDSIEYTFNYETGLKINKPIELQPNKTYAIAIDHGIVYWSEFSPIEVE